MEVIFSALSVKQHYIHGLGQPLALIQQWDNLMNTLLKMQQCYGSDGIQVVYHSANSAWQMKQQHRSPRDTICWKELLPIHDSTVTVTQNK